MARELGKRLTYYGLNDSLALCWASDEPPSKEVWRGALGEEVFRELDLLINMTYGLPAPVVRQFRRSALIDIDPGLCQIWLNKDHMQVPAHDLYFTIGETVGQPQATFPDCGLEWHYTPPCVTLDYWPVCETPPGAHFTTVSSWYQNEWVEGDDGWYINDKRSGFLPYLDLPKLTEQSLELALCSGPADMASLQELQSRGWHVRDALKLIATPQDYQSYIQGSLAEFSCVKPSCVRLQNAWISDRTLCYLASGKPAVVQNTGPSRFLPDHAGLLRFDSVEEAAICLETVAQDYERQSRLARELAEHYFDSPKVLSALLERALA